MIRPVQKPSQFKHLKNSVYCYEFSDFNGIYGYLGAEIIGPHCACHVAVLKWSHNIAKHMGSDWLTFIDQYLRPKGVKKITATFPNTTDRTWPKFIKMFGFPEPQKVMISTMEI